MPQSGFLAGDDWDLLRAVRLAALRDSPSSFLSRYVQEAGYAERHWRAELSRGDWLVDLDAGRPVGLLGAVAEPDRHPLERHLTYLWVAPDHRRAGRATALLATMLARLRADGVDRVWLWVLDGNSAARRLYAKLGFTATDERQPLPDDPSRSEERMVKDLA